MWKTKGQVSRIHGLLSHLKLGKEIKEEIIHKITQGRSSSAGDLTVMEADQVIKHLEELKRKAPRADIDSPENRMRRKVLSKFHEMNWRKNGKLDMPRINGWLNQYGHANEKYGVQKYPLNKYTHDELIKLVSQVEILVKDYYAKR